MLHFFRFGLIFLLMTLAVALPVKADPLAFVIASKPEIEKRLGADVLDALRELDDGNRSAAELEAIAHGLALRRHFGMAAWLYTATIERDPGAAAAWSSLGVMITEGATRGRNDIADESLLEGIVGLHREANRLAPANTTMMANLGTALTALGALRQDRAMIEEGAFLILKTVQANPQAVTAYVHLAEALKLIGETSAAGKFLEAAFHLNSAHPTLVKSLGPEGMLHDFPVAVTQPQYCQIDFGCDAKCPKSIVGQIDLVTCKMEEAGAQSSCLAGKPYPRFFDCSAKLPKFGILIPGIDPGLSILTPWGSFDVVVQGDGKVDFKLKILSPGLGPAQASFQTEGTWEPSRGAVALAFEAGGQVNLFDRASPVVAQANAYDVGLSVVEKYRFDGKPFESAIEIGRGSVLTY